MTTYRYKQPPTVQAWQWDGEPMDGEKVQLAPEFIDMLDFTLLNPRLGHWGMEQDNWLVQEGADAWIMSDTEFRATFEEVPE